MNKKRCIYLQEPLLTMLEKRGATAVSTNINRIASRYSEMLQHSRPVLTKDEYLQIITAMQNYIFKLDIVSEVALLPMTMRANGVSDSLSLKVGRKSFNEKVFIIDLLETY